MGSPRGAMANVLNDNIFVSDFKLQVTLSCPLLEKYYSKRHEPLLNQAVSLLFFYKMALALNNP